MTKILLATWNINYIRARLPVLLKWLEINDPDIVLLQELKASDKDIPKEEIENLKYNFISKGQKAYNGVSILSKYPLSDITYNLPSYTEDSQARYIEAWVNINNRGLRVASVYAPNGNPINTEKFSYKIKWLENFYKHSLKLLDYEELTILGGDYNICPNDIDAADVNLIAGDAIYQKQARNIFKSILNKGYNDAYRSLNLDDPGFTYWDYGRSFNNNIGVRIDHFLLSSYALDVCENIFVDKVPRAWERPSDHTPLCLEIDV